MRKVHSRIVKHIVRPLERNNMINLDTLILFYLSKIYQSKERGNTMTLTELQTDIAAVNNLLTAVTSFFPNATNVNSVVKFLEAADQNPLLLNIILVVVNGINPTPAPSPTPAPTHR